MSDETPSKKTRQVESQDSPAASSLGPGPEEIAAMVKKAQEDAKRQLAKAKEDIDAYKKRAAAEEAENPSSRKEASSKRRPDLSLEELKDGKAESASAIDESMTDEDVANGARKIFKAGNRSAAPAAKAKADENKGEENTPAAGTGEKKAANGKEAAVAKPAAAKEGEAEAAAGESGEVGESGEAAATAPAAATPKKAAAAEAAGTNGAAAAPVSPAVAA